MKTHKFKPATAAALIIANMIGTGVFTSLGFQLLDIQSGFALLMLWVVGGITALCGALSYAELGAALPRSGGEYNFLGRIFHPGAGFVSGWISLTIGFAAPSALAAITFGSYISSVFPALSATVLAVALVIILTFVHATNHRGSGDTQFILTLIKLLLIVGFSCLALAFVDEPQPLRFMPQSGDGPILLSGAFAVSLIYVNYAYTGWNAATYIIDELDSPQTHLPRILGLSTLLVMLIYLLLNFVFLTVTPIELMAGKVEIGYIAAQQVFGASGATVMGLVLGFLLISTVSAMVLAGPRVLQVMGEDFRAFHWLSKKTRQNIPLNAIVLQSSLTLLFIITSSFDAILVFAGFTLGINSLLTVVGLFVLRLRQPDLPRPYRVWLFPLPPLMYLAITLWTLAYIIFERPQEALASFALIFSGGVFYAVTARANK